MDEKDVNLNDDSGKENMSVNDPVEQKDELDMDSEVNGIDTADMDAVNTDSGDMDTVDLEKADTSIEDTDADNKGTEDKDEDKPFWKDLLEMLIYFAAVFILAVLIVTFVGQRTVVDGSSMSPTLSDKDNLIVDKISYRFSDPKRFDVVVFPYQHAKRTYYIKRIIGLPGEEVYIDPEGTIYINGEILEEDYGAEPIMNAGRADTPILLGPDEYFVMGDNRNNSSDSRDYMVGNINRKDLIGRAFIRIYPFKDFCLIQHGDE